MIYIYQENRVSIQLNKPPQPEKEGLEICLNGRAAKEQMTSLFHEHLTRRKRNIHSSISQINS